MKQTIIISKYVPFPATHWELTIHAVYLVENELVAIAKCRERDDNEETIMMTPEDDWHNVRTSREVDVTEELPVKSIIVDTKEELKEVLERYKSSKPLYSYSLEIHEAKITQEIEEILEIRKKFAEDIKRDSKDFEKIKEKRELERAKAVEKASAEEVEFERRMNRYALGAGVLVGIGIFAGALFFRNANVDEDASEALANLSKDMSDTLADTFKPQG